MKVLVTGASGFIGREIVSELSLFSLLNYEIIKVSSRKSKTEGFYRINISDEKDVKSLEKIGKVDVVIHSAGLAHQFGKTSREQFFEVNTKGTENICNLAVNLKAEHFIQISSVSVYGNSAGKKTGTDESFECRPEGFYATSKFEAEKIARKICEENKIPLTILRPATVIGEGDFGNVSRLIEAIDKKRFIWIGKGENSKSLIYKKDVAKACLAVLDKKTEKTEIFNVSAEALKMKEIVSLIAENLGRKMPKIFFPDKVLVKAIKTGLKISKMGKMQNLLNTVEKWIAEDFYTAEKIKTAYNFVPEICAEEALRREVNWYKKTQSD